MKYAVVLVAVTACERYAHRTTLDAPGNVDLSQPMPLENGDPKRVEQPAEPGSETLAVIAAPYFAGGAVRSGGGAEAGLELRVEKTTSTGRRLMAPENWGITAGLAFAQWGDTMRTVAPGAFYGEVGYRFFASYWPIDVGIGPMLYVDDTAVGGQLTARCAIALLRARYVANTGAELLFGVEVPIPFFFSTSR